MSDRALYNLFGVCYLEGCRSEFDGPPALQEAIEGVLDDLPRTRQQALLAVREVRLAATDAFVAVMRFESAATPGGRVDEYVHAIACVGEGVRPISAKAWRALLGSHYGQALEDAIDDVKRRFASTPAGESRRYLALLAFSPTEVLPLAIRRDGHASEEDDDLPSDVDLAEIDGLDEVDDLALDDDDDDPVTAPAPRARIRRPRRRHPRTRAIGRALAFAAAACVGVIAGRAVAPQGDGGRLGGLADRLTAIERRLHGSPVDASTSAASPSVTATPSTASISSMPPRASSTPMFAPAPAAAPWPASDLPALVSATMCAVQHGTAPPYTELREQRDTALIAADRSLTALGWAREAGAAKDAQLVLLRGAVRELCGGCRHRCPAMCEGEP